MSKSMSKSMSQSEAVVFYTKQVMGDRFQEGVDIKSYITKEERAEVSHRVTAGMFEGIVAISAEAKAKYGSDLRTKYVVGMVTNWYNKSTELNGGVKHVIQNPGSRSQDPQLKNLRLLLTKYEGKPEADAIRAAIANRLAELKPAVETESIDAETLPEALRKLVG